jgi:hypothetical protein
MFNASSRARWALGVGSAAVLALGAAGLTAGTAHASTGINISGLGVSKSDLTLWAGPGSLCANTGWSYCLFYGPDFDASSASYIWGSANTTTATISANFYNIVDIRSTGILDLSNTSTPVRNDAASMANPWSNCNVTTWVSPNYVGNYNWLTPSEGGNLTDSSNTKTGAYLRNNEAAISKNSCT